MKCRKEYPTKESLFSNVENGVKEVTLVCPHCRFSYHVFYTNEEFETRTQKLQALYARYRKTHIHQHLLEAKTAQESYRRDFEKFNKRLVAKRKPYRNRQTD